MTRCAVAFGLSAGRAPDRFLVGLAVLSLLAEVAEDQPLVCVVDDAQWLDRVSAQTLAFVARRLLAERVALVFAVRDPTPGRRRRPLAGLPELVGPGPGRRRCACAAGLGGPRAARRAGPGPDRRRDPRQPAGAAGAAAGADRGGAGRGLRASRTHGRWPVRSSRASCGASGRCRLRRSGCCWSRPPSRWATCRCWGGRSSGSGSGRTRRRRPRRRGWSSSGRGCGSGIRWCARRPTGRRTRGDRREAHRALAEATDPGSDPDRRAWHRAHAAVEPDEAVAAELERSADRAQARGGIAAAAAFLRRATELTPDPAGRGARALAAAQADLRGRGARRRRSSSSPPQS